MYGFPKPEILSGAAADLLASDYVRVALYRAMMVSTGEGLDADSCADVVWLGIRAKTWAPGNCATYEMGAKKLDQLVSVVAINPFRLCCDAPICLIQVISGSGCLCGSDDCTTASSRVW